MNENPYQSPRPVETQSRPERISWRVIYGFLLAAGIGAFFIGAPVGSLITATSRAAYVRGVGVFAAYGALLGIAIYGLMRSLRR
jgi:hypothetical protein